jgi:prepilin signal peptidase PulO-like enzyme (type II secretory pathway)
MEVLLSALLGWLLGGVINALADSLPRQGTVATPACQSCGGPRPWFAWLALMAVLGGHGHCQYCRQPIRARWLAIELFMIVTAVWLRISGAGLGSFGPGLTLAAIFTLIAVTDIEHRLILHVVSLPAMVIIGLVGVLDPGRGVAKTLLGGIAGFGIVLMLYLFGQAYAAWIARRRGQALEEIAFGFGDVTLATIMGLAVGWPGVVLALTLGVLSAGVFSLASLLWMLVRRRYQPHLPFPYGPFLILGAVLVYYGGSDLFQGLLAAG